MSIVLDRVNYKDKIKDISYTFSDREITFIMGIIGSGKTLLSYLLVGLIRIDSGFIKIDDNVIDKKTKRFFDIRRNIGYVFQNPKLEFFCKNCYDELSFSLIKYNIKDNIDKRIISSIEMVGLKKDILSVNPFNLSTGEQVKLAIAISLIHNPKYLIFDDVTVNLDNKTKKMLVKLIIKLKNKYKKTIIIISNDIDFILSFRCNIVLLENGVMKFKIKSSEFIDNIDVIRNSGVSMPKIIEFIDIYNKNRNKKIEYTLSINSLVDNILNE